MNSFIYTIYKQVMTYIGDVMVATKPPATKAKQMFEMRPYLTAGNVICRYYSYYLDSILIPGEFTHSGIVVNEGTIIHSVAEGVQDIHPIDFVKDTDGFIILRPEYQNKTLLKKAVEKARWHLVNKTEYDFTFSDPRKFYCHEMTVDCLNDGGIYTVSRSIKKFGIFPFRFLMSLYLAENIIGECRTEYVFRG